MRWEVRSSTHFALKIIEGDNLNPAHQADSTKPVRKDWMPNIVPTKIPLYYPVQSFGYFMILVRSWAFSVIFLKIKWFLPISQGLNNPAHMMRARTFTCGVGGTRSLQDTAPTSHHRPQWLEFQSHENNSTELLNEFNPYILKSASENPCLWKKLPKKTTMGYILCLVVGRLWPCRGRPGSDSPTHLARQQSRRL